VLIAFSAERNSDALFHIAVSVTSGMVMIPESSAEMDKEASEVCQRQWKIPYSHQCEV
jgi:hypothetical protein